MVIEWIVKFIPLLTTILGLPIPFLVWWTTHRGQRSQATKAELDALLTAVEKSQDVPYREFLLEIHKEKLVGMTTGCEVPRAEIGKIMECYKTAKYTPRQIQFIWPHRDRDSEHFRFGLDKLDLTEFWLFNAMLVLCVIEIVLATILVALTKGLQQWFYLGVELAFIGLFLLVVRLNQGLWVTYRLSRSQDK